MAVQERMIHCIYVGAIAFLLFAGMNGTGISASDPVPAEGTSEAARLKEILDTIDEMWRGKTSERGMEMEVVTAHLSRTPRGLLRRTARFGGGRVLPSASWPMGVANPPRSVIDLPRSTHVRPVQGDAPTLSVLARDLSTRPPARACPSISCLGRTQDPVPFPS